MSEKPEEVIRLPVTQCLHCQADLAPVAAASIERRQVVDVTRKRGWGTEYRAEGKQCPHCQWSTRASPIWTACGSDGRLPADPATLANGQRAYSAPNPDAVCASWTAERQIEEAFAGARTPWSFLTPHYGIRNTGWTTNRTRGEPQVPAIFHAWGR
jgi:hypothetical protein